MNYKRIYDNLIERAKTRTIDGYTEKHHIIPRCMNGSDDDSNLVRLTPEEHYIAHLLLVKIYPDNSKLVYAANMMCVSSDSHNGERQSNKRHGWLRRKMAEAHSKRIRDRMENDPEYRAKVSEWARKMGKAMKGVKRGPEFSRKLAERNRNTVMREETKRKIGEANKGRKRTEEYKRKHSERYKGEGNPMYGKRGKDHPAYGTKPWNNQITYVEQKAWWRFAGMFYDWYQRDIDRGTHKRHGHKRMLDELGFVGWREKEPAAARRSIEMFAKGWNPYEDQEWLDYVNTRFPNDDSFPRSSTYTRQTDLSQ